MKHLYVIFFLAVSILACDSKEQSSSNSESIQAPSQGTEEQNAPSRVNTVLDSLLENVNQEIREKINEPNLYLRRAAIYERFGDMPSSQKDLERAFLLDSTSLPTLIAYGEHYMKKGQLKASLDYFNRARVYHPEESVVYLKLGELFMLGKNIRKSLQNADLAIKYDKFNSQAYYLKGFNFLELKDTAKAISSFLTTIEQDPEHFESYMQLGLLYGAQDNPLAINFFENALDVKPNHKEALYGIAMFQQEHDMLNEALATYQIIVEVYPNFREAHYNLGYVHMYYLQLYRQATIHFTDAIEVDPNYYQAYYNRGYSFELLGDINNAAKDYKMSLSIQPDYDLAANGLSRVKGN